jgi:hypothetical protein
MEMPKRTALYNAYEAANNAWLAELEATYGKQAGDARYDPKRNRATPKLAELYDANRKAGDEWREYMRT